MITQSELKSLLHYNKSTGLFTWRTKRRGTNKSLIAGYCDPNGYVRICINGIIYFAHRLAFLYVNGYFPEHDIDHKKGIRSDNRWSEIRHATRSCNMQNQGISPKNKSGIPGVSWVVKDKKWRSDIRIDGKTIYLGYHDNKLEAALARYTFEAQCDKWTCNYRSELVGAILKLWPDFKTC